MSVFTSSLPDELLQRLDQLNRAEYVKSYSVAGKDEELMSIAEEGMEEYLKQIDDEAM